MTSSTRDADIHRMGVERAIDIGSMPRDIRGLIFQKVKEKEQLDQQIQALQTQLQGIEGREAIIRGNIAADNRTLDEIEPTSVMGDDRRTGRLEDPFAMFPGGQLLNAHQALFRGTMRSRDAWQDRLQPVLNQKAAVEQQQSSLQRRLNFYNQLIYNQNYN